MGTVIVYEGEALVFKGMEPEEALRSFLENWNLGVVKGIQLFPIIGYEEKGSLTGTYVLPGSWGDGE